MKFKRTAPTEWTDPDNWSSEDGNRATPHAERIPCVHDTAAFDPGKSFSAVVPDVPVTIGAVHYGNQVSVPGPVVSNYFPYLILSFHVANCIIIYIIYTRQLIYTTRVGLFTSGRAFTIVYTGGTDVRKYSQSANIIASGYARRHMIISYE